MPLTTFQVHGGIKGNNSDANFQHWYKQSTSIKKPTTAPTWQTELNGFLLIPGKLDCDKLETCDLQRRILIQYQC